MTKDRTFPAKSNDTSSGVIGLATPKDRLAAFILDASLLIPVIQLLQAPFKKGIMESLLYNSSDGASTYRFINLFVVFAVFLIYQTLLTYWKGQSFGKMFFHLKVISYQGKLTLYHCFIRNLLIVFEFLTLGWLWSALFSHPMRRVFHDRASDTLVISLKNPVGLPTKKEIFSARLLNGVFSLTLVFLISGYILVDDDKGNSFQALVFGEDQCKEMKAQEGYNVEDFIVFHLERKVSSQCLYDFARKSVWSAEDKKISHFAMALALKSSKDDSQQYLDEICRIEKKSSLCLLGQWLGKRASGEEALASNFYSKIKNQRNSKVVKIILSRYLQKDKEFEMSLEVLASIEESKSLNGLKASLSFQSLLSLDRFDEAYWVFKTHDKVSEKDLKNFYGNWKESKKKTVLSHIQFLEKLYPSLTSQPEGRGLASTPESLQEIKSLHQKLKGFL